MKILFLINQFADGGRERRMVELVCGLNRTTNIQMHTIVFHSNVDYPNILNTRMTFECIKEPNRFARCAKIESVIKTYKPDIVHSWVDTPTEMLLLGFLKSKYHFKYIAGFIADGNIDSPLSPRRISMIYTFFKADAIISNSYAGLIAKKAPKNKSYVIYNGFDFQRIPSGLNKEAKRKELGITSRYLVVMCARIDSAKDWESYIELAKLTKQANLDVTFIAVGYGNKLEYYQNLTEIPNSNIHFIGRRTDVEEILSVSDFGILFTNSRVHAEGVSNSILETMACGVPVIATSGGGTEEIIENNRNGYIIDEYDSVHAFHIITQLITDNALYKHLSINAVNTIITKFSISQMIESYTNLYNDLTKQ